MTQAAAAPTAQRIESLDFLRGVALLGILLMNIVGMGLGPAYDNPTVAGGATGVNLWSWIIAWVAFEGTQRALFSILFGAGVILFTQRAEASGRPDSADLYFRRNLWLIAFGLVNAWVLLFVGDILYYYGITGLFLYAFRKLSGQKLLAIGTAALLLGAAWSAIEAVELLHVHDEYRSAAQVPEAARSQEQKAAVEAWRAQESERNPGPQAYAQIRAGVTASYWSALKSYAPIISHFQSWQLYRYFFDIFGAMMIGMALFKLGVLTLEVRRRVYLGMMAAGYAIGLTCNILEVRWLIANQFSPLAYTQIEISYDVGRIGTTMGHLGALMLLLRSGLLGWLRRSLAAVGRMALTNYLTHSLVALVIFVLLGWFGHLQRHQLYFIVFAVWTFQLAASPLWLKHFHFGPVEWLWRYLTYGRRPPFRRERGSSPA